MLSGTLAVNVAFVQAVKSNICPKSGESIVQCHQREYLRAPEPEEAPNAEQVFGNAFF